jgi:hypothetical protein
MRLIIGWGLLILGLVGIFYSALTVAEGSPGKPFQPIQPIRQQTTMNIDYTNTLSSSFIAQELELASNRVASVTIVPTSGCSVSFNLPLRTDLDQEFDRNGNVVTQRTRAVNELTEQQQERLDQLMRTQGCFRARP